MPGEIRIQWIQIKMSDKFDAAFAKADADGSGSIGKFSKILEGKNLSELLLTSVSLLTSDQSTRSIDHRLREGP